MREWLDFFEGVDEVTTYIHNAHKALGSVNGDIFVDLQADSGHQFYSNFPIVLIADIEVPEEVRGAGVGSQAMNILIKLADTMQVTLALTAADDDLAYWYERFGFHGERHMIREPRTNESQQGLLSEAAEVLNEIYAGGPEEHDDQQVRDRIRDHSYYGGWQVIAKAGDVYVKKADLNDGEIGLRLVKNKKAIGYASLLKMNYSGVDGYIAVEVGVVEGEKFNGYGKLLYNTMLNLGHVIFSGGQQTPDGRKMWHWLLKQPNVHCYVTTVPDSNDEHHPYLPVENGVLPIDPWREKAARLVASRTPLVTKTEVKEEEQPQTPADELRRRVETAALPARVTIVPWKDTGRHKNVADVTDLEASATGKGQGRETMQAVIQWADELGVTLFVWPVPDHDVPGALGHKDLMEWYQRLGFKDVWEEGEEWRMVRTPKGAR
jgi:GNAT superfamily N-acetyltransferase